MKLIHLILLYFVFSIQSPFSVAEELPQVVLATGEWAPFAGEKLPGGGMLVEVVVAALTAVNQPYKLEYLPWKRGYQYAADAKVLGTFPWGVTEERKQIFNYTDSIYRTTEKFFVRKKFDKKFTTSEDLKGLTVCLPMGWSMAPIQRFLDKKILNLYQPHTDEACFKAMKSKRVDLYSVNKLAGWEAIKLAGLKTDDFKMIGPVLRENFSFIMVSKKHPKRDKFIKIFNKGISAIKENGTYQKIIDKHMLIIQGGQ